MKKLLTVLITFMLVFISACSKESKFGAEQFVTRMNHEYETDFMTSDFLLCKAGEKNALFCDGNDSFITLSLDSENEIVGVGLMITADSDTGYGTEMFCKISSVFTGNDYDTQNKILSDCSITANKIKFTDSNTVITVGKFKYTTVCNKYSVTLFCDRI